MRTMSVKITNTGTGNNIVKNKLEDLKVLGFVDKILKYRRGYVFRMPEKGSSVVACVSGGLDSIINIAILMEKFGLKVYPFFINRGQTNYVFEKKAIKFFQKYYKEKYPHLYNDCLEISLKTPSEEYKNFLREVKGLKDNSFLRNSVSYPARNPIIALTGMEYAYSLQAKKVYIKNVFATHTADDPVYHSSLTVLRTDNLLMCEVTGDYNWQFTSIPIERELDNYYGKSVLVKWANQYNIPLEKTRSCYKNTEKHCGQCYPACVNRKKAFSEAGIKDLTDYKSECVDGNLSI
jgi:7-cyano-7-deazaguanine synthase in queuosine biosynthesis